MKLLFISKYAATPDTDVPSRQYYFAKKLAQRGHQVMLVNSMSNGVFKTKKQSGSPLSEGVWGFAPRAKIENLQVKTLPGPIIALGMNIKRIWSWLWFEIQLLRNYSSFRAFAPDIVLVSSLSFLSFWNGIRLKKKLNIPLVIEIRDIYPMTLVEVGGMSRWNPIVVLMGWLEKRAYKEADLIVSSLENAMEHVDATVGADGHGPFFWLPMGWEGSMYVDIASAGKPRVKPGVTSALKQHPMTSAQNIISEIQALKEKGKFIVGYAGTLGKANALGELLSLVGEEEMMKAGIYFVMIGGGPKAVDYEREFGGMNIRFYPAIAKKELPSVLSECDLLYNSWLKRDIYQFGISPNKWIDYMYAGRPVLLAFSGKSAIFKQADFGWMIEAENRQDLKESLLGIRSLSQEELNKKGQNGRQYLEKNLKYSELASKLEEKLEAVIHGE